MVFLSSNRLDSLVENTTKDRGGARPAAGRPRQIKRTATQSVRLPAPIADVAKWLKYHPEALPQVQILMQKFV